MTSKEQKCHANMKHRNPSAITLLIGIVIGIATIQLPGPVNGAEIKYNGDEKRSHVVSPLPYTYVDEDSLPKSFDWGRVDGGRRSLLTHVLNQHIPQVCTWFCLRVCLRSFKDLPPLQSDSPHRNSQSDDSFLAHLSYYARLSI